MKKYNSNIISPKDIKIDIETFSEDNEQYKILKILYLPKNIEVCEIIENGHIETYNKCMKRLEFLISYCEFKKYYDKNPDEFAENYLGIKLRPYQRQILKMLKNHKNINSRM